MSNVNAAQRIDVDFVAEMGDSHLPLGSTIAGARLDFVINRDTAAAAGTETSGCWLGMIVLDENVAADVQTPTGDPHADWMYRQFVPLPVTVDTRVSSFDNLGGSIQIRSKRKIEELGTNAWFCIQGDLAADDIDARVALSTLLLLS